MARERDTSAPLDVEQGVSRDGRESISRYGGIDLRGEEAPFASEDGDVDVIAGGDPPHQLGQTVIEVLIQGIEFPWVVDRNDGNLPLCLELDYLLCSWRAHCCFVLLKRTSDRWSLMFEEALETEGGGYSGQLGRRSLLFIIWPSNML